MAGLPQLQAQTAPRLISDPTAIDSFADVSGGIIDVYNDTSQQYKGKRYLPFYVQKAEGYAVLASVEERAAIKGAHIWKDPDTDADNRFHKIFSVANKVFLYSEDGLEELYDIADKDGYTVRNLFGAQVKNNSYFCIGDPAMDSFLYKYIGAQSGAMSSASGTTSTTFVSVNHGLTTGMTISIASTSYNGDYEITVVDVDSFTIQTAYVSDETGNWTCSKQFAKQSMTGMRAASRIFSWEQRLGVTGCGSDRSLPQFSRLDVYGNYTSFAVDVTTVGGGDFFGDLGGINCMLNHDGYGLLMEEAKITVHSIGDPVLAGTTSVRDPDTLNKTLTVSGNGTTSAFGAISARGAVYYVDPSSGVYELKIGTTISGFSRANKPLTATWQTEFLKYDTSSASIAYDSKRDILIVTAASAYGGIVDRALYYSFRTGRWSIDPGKSAKIIIPSREEGIIYGFSSTGPDVQHFFDGTYNDDGADKEVVAWTRYFDGGNRAIYKEHENSTEIIGIHPETSSVLFELINGANEVVSSTDVDLTDEASPTLSSAGGAWGQYVIGAGAQGIENSFVFKQYYNDDPFDDFQRISMRITEKSAYPFMMFAPSIYAVPTSDFAEDIS